MSRDIRQGICPSCDHNEIIEGIPIDFGTNTPGHAPLAVAHKARRFRGVDPAAPLGALRVYVCRRCGLTQWYADHPDEIPIGEEHTTRLITGPRSDPYR